MAKKNIKEYTVKHKLPIALLVFLYLCLGAIIFSVKTNIVMVDQRKPIVIEIQHTTASDQTSLEETNR